MGTDIRGWVEIRIPRILEDDDSPDHWASVITVRSLLGRNYDAFGCLFGVTNYAHFKPIAAGRGLPADVSDTVREQADHFSPLAGAYLEPTWVSWAELRAMDWDEEALEADSRLHQYRRNQAGELVYDTKAGWDRRFAEHTTSSPGAVLVSMIQSLVEPVTYAVGQEWEIDGVVYRAEKLRRRDALGADWEMVFGLMETLAQRYGDDGVRLVVWFDV